MNPNIEFSIKTAQAYNAVCKPLCQELGLSQTALDILLFLANNPDYKTARDIVELRGLTKSHICQSVDGLTRRGWLSGVQDGQDRRRVHLSLLPAAQTAVAAALKDGSLKLPRPGGPRGGGGGRPGNGPRPPRE